MTKTKFDKSRMSKPQGLVMSNKDWVQYQDTMEQLVNDGVIEATWSGPWKGYTFKQGPNYANYQPTKH